MVNQEVQDIITVLLFSPSVLENLLLTTQSLLRSAAFYFLMHELAAPCCRQETDRGCVCWLMLALRTNKVGHSVFMQVDEETLSATFCERLPAASVLVW